MSEPEKKNRDFSKLCKNIPFKMPKFRKDHKFPKKRNSKIKYRIAQSK